MEPNQWTHLAVSFQYVQRPNGIAKFYVNGRLAESIATPFVSNRTRPLWIGASNTQDDKPDYYFFGCVVESAIYDYGLTEGQIQRHYQLGISPKN
jgi:hypothetical protein